MIDLSLKFLKFLNLDYEYYSSEKNFDHNQQPDKLKYIIKELISKGYIRTVFIEGELYKGKNGSYDVAFNPNYVFDAQFANLYQITFEGILFLEEREKKK